MTRTAGSISYRTWKKQMTAYLRAAEAFKNCPEEMRSLQTERLTALLPSPNLTYMVRFFLEYRKP